MFRISLIATLIFSQFALSSVYSYKSELSDMARQGHQPVDSYSQARKHIMQDIALRSDSYGYYVGDVYCNERFRKNVGPRKMPDHNQLNIEHTWPQSKFTSRHPELTQKTDLHHLYPTNSKANGRRGHLLFGDFPDNSGNLSYCPESQVGDLENGQEGFEPPTHQKGNVARALFYFSLRYDISINDYEEVTLRFWNILDPVDADEMDRNNIIESLQGNRNPFIDDASYADLVTDF